MVEKYDPEMPPNKEAWLKLDEDTRIDLIQNFHRDTRVPLPKSARHMHATIHLVVENQLVLEEESVVRATLGRLRSEGLSRHDAIHAIGSVFIEYLYEESQKESPDSTEFFAGYQDALKKLTAEAWRNM